MVVKITSFLALVLEALGRETSPQDLHLLQVSSKLRLVQREPGPDAELQEDDLHMSGDDAVPSEALLQLRKAKRSKVTYCCLMQL